ncbi:MAG: NAD(P)/FAD-dependent oxidoreductase [Nitrospiria bacterium]
MPGYDDIYDAIIVGAGPAGGACARELSSAGRKVLLVEKAKDFLANDFSTGGSTPETLKTFRLPKTVVGAFCRKVKITASDESHLWQSDSSIAIVFDFRKLRSFLANETHKKGSDLLFSRSYKSHEHKGNMLLVSFKKAGTKNIEYFQTKVLVDATGSERRVLSGGAPRHLNAIVGTGIEFLVEVPEDIYRHHADCLSFFIGRKWMPQGYAWIFPMEANRLKVGVGRNYPNEQIVPHEKSFRFYLDHLMSSCLQTRDITILDQHGKTLSYTSRQRDRYFDKNIIAIGDAVSTVNPLTFEGIRHAMMSGRIAARHVNNLLSHKIDHFKPYKTAMRRLSGFKWVVSEQLTEKIYREADDQNVSLMLAALKYFSMEALLDLVFYYRLKSAFKFIAAYAGLRLKAVLKGPR